MNIAKMLKQAQQMQERLSTVQAELAGHTVQAELAGGKVTVVANAAGDVLSIKIAPEIVDPNDVEMLEDMVLTTVREALKDGRQRAAEEMKKITGGMPLPGIGM